MQPNIQNKCALLLTGTIVPNSIYTEYNNAGRRLQDHMEALRFYSAALPQTDIYFLENSEYDLDNDQGFAGLRKEIKFEVLRFPKSNRYNEGKGYQEFEMLDQAIEKLQNLYSEFIKITGRYIVLNIDSIVKNKSKGLRIDLNKRQQYAHTYVMQFNTAFYLQHLCGLYQLVNDKEGRHIEHVIFQKLKSEHLLKSCELFRKTPLTQGKTGSFGISLQRNRFRVFFRKIESFFYNKLGIPAFFY